MSDDELPVVTVSDVERAVDENTPTPSVVGLVLAAGTSSRFGPANKLLADIDGEPVISHAVRTMLDAPVASVVVVVGHDADTVRDAVTDAGTEADTGVTVVENPAYSTGQATSVQVGIEAVGDAGASAVVVLPGDMPAVTPTTVARLIDAYRAGVGDAVAAAYHGQRGNPVLFDRRYFDGLLSTSGDVGGRSVLLDSDDAVLVNVDDPGVSVDIDTPDDLASVD